MKVSAVKEEEKKTNFDVAYNKQFIISPQKVNNNKGSLSTQSFKLLIFFSCTIMLIYLYFYINFFFGNCTCESKNLKARSILLNHVYKTVIIRYQINLVENPILTHSTQLDLTSMILNPI